MNVLLVDHAHRVIKIPATSLKSIVGVEHDKIPDDLYGSKTIIRYDYGAGPMFAWLRTAAAQVMAQVAECTKAAPQAWLPLVTPEGDDIYIPAALLVAIHGLAPEECGGANSRVDFDAFGDGREIKFARVVETPDEIETVRVPVEQSIAEAALLAPVPAAHAKRAHKI